MADFDLTYFLNGSGEPETDDARAPQPSAASFSQDAGSGNDFELTKFIADTTIRCAKMPQLVDLFGSGVEFREHPTERWAASSVHELQQLLRDKQRWVFGSMLDYVFGMDCAVENQPHAIGRPLCFTIILAV